MLFAYVYRWRNSTDFSLQLFSCLAKLSLDNREKNTPTETQFVSRMGSFKFSTRKCNAFGLTAFLSSTKENDF